MLSIFGPKRDYVAGGWKRLHNEELHNLYTPQNIIRVIRSRRMRWVGHVTRMRDLRYVYGILVSKLERKRPLGRHRRRWEDGIRMDVSEIRCKVMDWMHLAQDRDQ